jgi:hypothetical protein
MSRKHRKPPRESNASKLPPDIFPPRFRAPREMRVVSATTIALTDSSKSKRTERRVVPQIRLSGAWLERVGFKRGTRFLILADVPNQILLALIDS